MKVTVLLFAVIGCCIFVATEAQSVSPSTSIGHDTSTGGTHIKNSSSSTNGIGTGTGTGSGTPGNATAPGKDNGACSHYHVGFPLIVGAFISSLFGFL